MAVLCLSTCGLTRLPTKVEHARAAARVWRRTRGSSASRLRRGPLTVGESGALSAPPPSRSQASRAGGASPCRRRVRGHVGRVPPQRCTALLAPLALAAEVGTRAGHEIAAVEIDEFRDA